MVSVLEEIRLQASYCSENQFGSPFTEQLLTRCADDLASGGIVAKLTDGWTGNPRTDAVSLRIAGAVHAAALMGKDQRLQAEYPDTRTDWSMDRVWPLAKDFLRREEAWVRDFMKSPPQTNETARATGLVCGFLWLAQQAPQPFHMLELGASAGLNLNWDRFRYAHPPWRKAGGQGPLIPTVVSGHAPEWGYRCGVARGVRPESARLGQCGAQAEAAVLCVGGSGCASGEAECGARSRAGAGAQGRESGRGRVGEGEAFG